MEKTFIIAEAGDNHNGSLELAKKLVDCAVKAKANAIKFQTFITEEVISKFAPKAEYQKQQTDINESQFDMVKKLELSFEDFIELKKYCDNSKIQFLSTPFDLLSIDFLNSIGMPIWKIPSGEITNLPYLIKVAQIKKPVILSTGMSTIDEIEKAVNILKKYGCPKLTLLQCNTEYPTPFEDVNLKAMNLLKSKFNCDIGYSDHTIGIEASIAAVALGAKVIEKHFTLDKNMKGPDHKASIDFSELSTLIKSIRNVEKALGIEEKVVSNSEYKNIDIARKSIVARTNIKKGEKFTVDNIATKRPGNGISPMKWFEVLGSVSKRNFKKDELIEL